MAKASVIIPVYNAAKSLPRCFDSILNQTYRDFEIIVINDGSTDQSQNIINLYAEKSPDLFRVYTQKNQGVAAARNSGMQYAQGEYIFFVDNDDYISGNYLNDLVTEAEHSHAEMVITGYCRIREDKKILYKRPATDSDWLIFQLQAPWARLYRSDFIKENNLRFLSNPIGEDVYFNILAACLCKKWSYVPSISYFWVDNAQSVSNTKQKGMNKIASPFEMLQIIHDETLSAAQNEPLRSNIEYFFIRYAVWYILFSGRNADPRTANKMYLEMFAFIRKLYPDYFKNRNLRLTLPKGETFFNRFSVWSFILLHRIHAVRLFLSVYCKGRKENIHV